jgi:capsid protein
MQRQLLMNMKAFIYKGIIDFKEYIMTKKFIHQTQKAITTRFSITDYLNIEEEAEKLGTSLADVIRKSWKEYQKENEFKDDLKELENSLVRTVFEVCSAVAGLTSEQREEAKNDLKKALKGGGYE